MMPLLVRCPDLAAAQETIRNAVTGGYAIVFLPPAMFDEVKAVATGGGDPWAPAANVYPEPLLEVGTALVMPPHQAGGTTVTFGVKS